MPEERFNKRGVLTQYYANTAGPHKAVIGDEEFFIWPTDYRTKQPEPIVAYLPTCQGKEVGVEYAVKVDKDKDGNARTRNFIRSVVGMTAAPAPSTNGGPTPPTSMESGIRKLTFQLLLLWGDSEKAAQVAETAGKIAKFYGDPALLDVGVIMRELMPDSADETVALLKAWCPQAFAMDDPQREKLRAMALSLPEELRMTFITKIAEFNLPAKVQDLTPEQVPEYEAILLEVKAAPHGEEPF